MAYEEDSFSAFASHLTELIQTAVDLANSVQKDAVDNTRISDQTIILLSTFKKKHDELDGILDLLSGLN